METEILQCYKLIVSDISTVSKEATVFIRRFIIRLAQMVKNGDIVKGLQFRADHLWDSNPVDVCNPYACIVHTIQVPLKDMMPPGVNGETHVKTGIIAMQQSLIQYTDKDPHTGRKYWTSVTFFGKVAIKKGIIYADIRPEAWRAIFDFLMGFHTLDLKVMMEFKSKYSMKLYPYVCRQMDPSTLTMSAEDCKKFLEVEKRYKQTIDFIKKCIVAAQQELNELNPWSYDFELLKTTDKGRPVIAGIRFIPRNQAPQE